MPLPLLQSLNVGGEKCTLHSNARLERLKIVSAQQHALQGSDLRWNWDAGRRQVGAFVAELWLFGVTALLWTAMGSNKCQPAFLILLLAKGNCSSAQLGRRMKGSEVAHFFFFSLFHLLCKYELIHLLKQQIHNYTQSAITNGGKEATGSKVICLRPCSLWLTSSE